MRRSLVLVLLIAAWMSLGGCQRRPELAETGCTAFVFAIDTSGREAEKDLAASVAQAVLKRLDPKGQYGIVVSPIAPNQIEVRIQHPPNEVRELGRVFNESLEKLTAANVTQEEVTAALQLTAGRAAALERLVRGHPTRQQKLAALADAYDQSQRGGSELVYWRALQDVFKTSISANDVRFALELTEPGSTERKEWLAQGREQFPHLRQEIDEVVTRHRAWRAKGIYIDDPGEIIPLLRGMGILEFRILAEPDPGDAAKYDRYRVQLQQRGPTPQPGDELGWFRIENPAALLSLDSPAELAQLDVRQSTFVIETLNGDYYVLARLAPEHGLLRGEKWKVRSAAIGRDRIGRPSIDFELDANGGELFSALTRNNIGEHLCILVDDVAYSAPTIQSTIATHGQVTGDFTLEKARYLARTLGGQLPARLAFPPVSERVVHPQP